MRSPNSAPATERTASPDNRKTIPKPPAALIFSQSCWAVGFPGIYGKRDRAGIISESGMLATKGWREKGSRDGWPCTAMPIITESARHWKVLSTILLVFLVNIPYEEGLAQTSSEAVVALFRHILQNSQTKDVEMNWSQFCGLNSSLELLNRQGVELECTGRLYGLLSRNNNVHIPVNFGHRVFSEMTQNLVWNRRGNQEPDAQLPRKPQWDYNRFYHAP